MSKETDAKMSANGMIIYEGDAAPGRACFGAISKRGCERHGLDPDALARQFAASGEMATLCQRVRDSLYRHKEEYALIDARGEPISHSARLDGLLSDSSRILAKLDPPKDKCEKAVDPELIQAHVASKKHWEANALLGWNEIREDPSLTFLGGLECAVCRYFGNECPGPGCPLHSGKPEQLPVEACCDGLWKKALDAARAILNADKDSPNARKLLTEWQFAAQTVTEYVRLKRERLEAKK